MSKLTEFRKLEQQLARQRAELEAMKVDAGLKNEIEFETKLRALLGEYGVSLKNIINLLDPHANVRSSSVAVKSKAVKPGMGKSIKTQTLVNWSKRKAETIVV